MPIVRVVLALVALALAAIPSHAQERTHVYCGQLLAVPGEAPLGASTVIILDGVIESVREGTVRPTDGAAEVDLSDRFVLPGLFDCHTHITGQSVPVGERIRRAMQETYEYAAIDGTVYAEKTLMAGFTSIRNVGSGGRTALALRDRINAGMVVGPRMLCSGPAVSVTGGHGDWTNSFSPVLRPDQGPETGPSDGPAEVRKAVRARIREGVDLIKITATGGVLSYTGTGVNQQFFQDELDAIVEAAHRMGRKVAAHAHGADGVKAALRAGVDSIEHGTYTDDEAIALFLETGAYLVPTIHAGKFVAEKAEQEGYYPPAIRIKASRVGPEIQAMFARAHEAGVKIAFGTDVGVGAHGTNALEFVYMTEVGMSNADAIKSATVNAADLCGVLDTLGTIEPGKHADLIATASSPLADITELQRVRFVMKGGVVHKAE
ncbi:MAG: amidohydrolase family protein [Planctomycetota bacterium]